MSTIYRVGTLADVRNQTLLRDQAIIVDGERITVVRPWAEVGAVADYEDLSDSLVAPGLIDLHTHLIGKLDHGGYDSFLKDSGGAALFEGVLNAATTLRAGFTTVRDMGTFRAFLDCDLRDAIERGIVPGPRMHTTGGYVTSSGGGGEITDLGHDIELPRSFRMGVADSVDEIRRAVRTFIHGGADGIKVIATGAVLAAGTVPGAPEFTEEQLRAAVEEAALYGKGVAAHAHGTLGALWAVRAGVRTLDHGSFIEGDEIFDALLASDTVYVPTTYVVRHLIDTAEEAGYSPEIQRKSQAALETAMAALRTAVRRGVKLAYGTDAIVYPHGDNAAQMVDFVEAGLSPFETLRTATINAADVLDSNDVGVIEAGRFADFVAIKGETELDDVTIFQNIDVVVKGGRRVE